jgi:hypothetical protein
VGAWASEWMRSPWRQRRFAPSQYARVLEQRSAPPPAASPQLPHRRAGSWARARRHCPRATKGWTFPAALPRPAGGTATTPSDATGRQSTRRSGRTRRAPLRTVPKCWAMTSLTCVFHATRACARTLTEPAVTSASAPLGEGRFGRRRTFLQFAFGTFTGGRGRHSFASCPATPRCSVA